MTTTIDALDFEDQEALLNGMPFSGIAYETFVDSPHFLRRALTYCNGFAHGLCKQWYNSGQLQIRWTAHQGAAHGEYTEWYPDGTVKIIANYIHGVEISITEYDQQGEVSLRRSLDPSSPQYQYAMNRGRTQDP